MKKLILFFAIIILSGIANAQHIETLQQGNPASIRGLSVPDDNIAWVSGSKGTIAITRDGGKTWAWKQVKGYEKSDFRGIEAFSDKEAVIMSSGSPAVILRTTDGGETWREKYKKTDSIYFFDAIAFDTPKHGLVLGDPIQNKFLLMETNDGGETWHPFKNPPDAIPGEACFAASGTCLRISCGQTYIVTGGAAARLITWNGKGLWDFRKVPLPHNKASQGSFSFICGDNLGILVGGDYSDPKRADSVAVIQSSRNTFALADKGPAGFQSCIEHVGVKTFLSTGTSGSNVTADGGKTWRRIDDASYNVCRKAKNGSLVLLAGDHGRVGVFKP